MSIRVRFAPSPTGMVHVGSVRTALYNFMFAKKHGGKYLLRIEDTDQSRKVEGAVENLIKSLRRLGIDHDEGPDVGGHYGPYYQSMRLELYTEYIKKLIEGGHAYPCFCSTQRLDSMRSQQEAQGLRIGYDRHCLHLSESDRQTRLISEQHVIRMKVPDDLTIRFKDLVRGEVEVNTSTIDDQILIKSDGFPTYHFANVVDDHAMKISHVIRGEEWLPSTPKHILLYDFFGWEKPYFAHLPLLLNPDRSKLSKRQGDVAVEDYLNNGFLEEALINFLALLGWSPGDNRELMEISEMIDEFDLDRVNKAGAVFDQEKLAWVNSQYLKARVSDERYLKLVRPQAKHPALENWEPQILDKVLLTLRNQLDKPGDIKTLLPLFLERPDAATFQNPEIHAVLALESNKSLFEYLISRIESSASLTSEQLRDLTRSAQKDLSIKGKALFMPIRVALTGNTSGPEVFVFAEGLGKHESLERLKLALEMHLCREFPKA